MNDPNFPRSLFIVLGYVKIKNLHWRPSFLIGGKCTPCKHRECSRYATPGKDECKQIRLVGVPVRAEKGWMSAWLVGQDHILSCTGPEFICMVTEKNMSIQRRKEWGQKKNFTMTKIGWAFLIIWGQKSLTAPQLPILGYLAKLCSANYKDVLLSGLCPEETCLIRERTELQPGLTVIRSHESSLALALGHHQRNCNFSICMWAQLRARGGWGRELFLAWSLTQLLAELSMHISSGKRREGGYGGSHVHAVTREIPIHLISFIFLTALLRYNLHTIKFSHCNCTVWWFLAYLCNHATITTVQF